MQTIVTRKNGRGEVIWERSIDLSTNDGWQMYRREVDTADMHNRVRQWTDLSRQMVYVDVPANLIAARRKHARG
jgi:hypothetical protein